MTHQKNTAQTGFVKKLLAHAAMALCAMAAPAANANTADTPDSDSPGKRHSLETGLLIYASDVTSVGVNFRYAYALGETNRLTFDLGACFDVDPKVTGHFAYHYSGSSITHYDGKIQVNHTIVPILIGWEYEWKLGNGNWAFHLGPVLGFAFVNGKEERNPRVTNASNTFRSDSGTAFLIGANAGLRWNFISADNRWFADFSLAALGGTDVKLDKLSEKINLSGARIMTTVGFCF